MPNQLPNIVVIGGGFAGSAVAKEIAEKLDISTHRLTFVTPRSKFVQWPSMVRASVTSEGEIEKQGLMSYGDFLKGKGEVKIGKMAGFTSEQGGNGGGVVTLESGEKLEYSILVLATGNQWSGPFAFPDDINEVVEHLKSWRAKFEAANDIVLVGGGVVSVELAAEIKDFYPGKNVTIVHSDTQLLSSAYPDRWRKSVLEGVARNGVKVVLGDRVESTAPLENGTVSTRNGINIVADLVVATWGGKPNTTLIKESLGDHVATATGHIKVRPTLQLPGYPRVFAAGDIINWSEQKQAAKVGGHSAIITANVFSLLEGIISTKEYKGQREMIVITLGRNGGSTYLGILWGIILGNWFSRFVKSKGLMIETSRKQFGFPSTNA